jgi:phosphopantetheine--protein transferase-like protein
MEATVKDIISHFLKKPASEIGASTVIDRTAVAGSILIHRMYAALSEAGFAVQDYQQVRTFAELMARLGGNSSIQDEPGVEVKATNQPSIGVDIQAIDELPEASDYRAHVFYQESFSPEEISYCLLQRNPRQSFAGLFAAKEALVKANNGLKNRPFKDLVIQHDQRGKPVFESWQLSISHSGPMAMAAAMFVPPPVQPLAMDEQASAREEALEQTLTHLSQSNGRLKRGLMLSGFIALCALSITIINYFQLFQG